MCQSSNLLFVCYTMKNNMKLKDKQESHPLLWVTLFINSSSWSVPGNVGLEGNEEVDELAKKEAAAPLIH